MFRLICNSLSFEQIRCKATQIPSTRFLLSLSLRSEQNETNVRPKSDTLITNTLISISKLLVWPWYQLSSSWYNSRILLLVLDSTSFDLASISKTFWYQKPHFLILKVLVWPIITKTCLIPWSWSLFQKTYIALKFSNFDFGYYFED